MARCHNYSPRKSSVAFCQAIFYHISIFLRTMTNSDGQTDETNMPDNDIQEQDELAALRAEVAEWKELSIRRSAELENFRKRTATEKEYLTLYGAERFISKLLPVFDDLNKALEAAQNSPDHALLNGLQMVYNNALKVLAESGVSVIECNIGDPFDVNIHEALIHVPSDLPEGHITQIIERGYQFHDKVLRHVKVVTSSGTPQNESDVTE